MKASPYSRIDNIKSKKDDYMKIKKFLLLILILPLLMLVGCTDADVIKTSKKVNTYTMDIVYNENHSITVQEKLEYKNNTDTTLDNLQMHLYPRSFRQGAKSSVVSSLNYSKCYYKGPSYGDMNIEYVAVNGIEQEKNIVGNDEDILQVDFTDTLKPDNKVSIEINFTVSLPNINHRFGYGEDTINIANFYPIACIYEDGKFNISSYHHNGDPFYSEVANYHITLHTPSKYRVASTGNVSVTNTEDETDTYKINALAVRDFAIVLSDKFEVVSGKVNNTNVNYYYYKNQYPSECLKASIQSVETFNKLFGKYPYDVLNVLETNFVHGGMEYPNLVYISDAVDVQSDYINVIVHEIAHQWWYGLVGNNEYNYGWLDEGLTEYSTLLFYEENSEYGVDSKELIKNNTNSFATFVEVYKKVFGDANTTMNRNLDEYNNESEYVYIAYVKGMLLFDSLREVMGKDKFIKALQQYYKDNVFKNVTPDNLINSMEKSSRMDLRDFFDSWMNGKVQIIQMN